MSAVLKAIIRVSSLCFMLITLALLMVSMMTHHWREAEAEIPGLKLDFNHGLWTQCGKVTLTRIVNGTAISRVTTDECTRISSSQVSDERKNRGRATRILMGVEIITLFLAFGLAFINVFNLKHNIYKYTQLIAATLLFVAFLTGIAGMASFTDYFDGEDLIKPPFPPAPYSWSYSWRIGWAGTILLIIPFFLSLVDGITFPKQF